MNSPDKLTAEQLAAMLGKQVKETELLAIDLKSTQIDIGTALGFQSQPPNVPHIEQQKENPFALYCALERYIQNAVSKVTHETVARKFVVPRLKEFLGLRRAYFKNPVNAVSAKATVVTYASDNNCWSVTISFDQNDDEHPLSIDYMENGKSRMDLLGE